MRARFNVLIRALRRMSGEDVLVALFGASFCIGIWYAFPMVNNSTDVWPLGGGVLRAIEAHTLLPGPDVAYGTLSFYQNYVLMVAALAIGYVAAGFDIGVLKEVFVFNPSLSLLVPRIASTVTAIALLAFVYHFLKRQVPPCAMAVCAPRARIR